MISALKRVIFEFKFYQISIRDAWEIHRMGQNSKNNKQVMRKTKMNKMNQFIQIVNPLTLFTTKIMILERIISGLKDCNYTCH